jgi:hypothetical protein
MRFFLQRLSLILITCVGLILLISFIPVRHDFFVHELAGTQYEKIVWIVENIREKRFNNHYKAVFLGSSQCLYGINDSILGSDYLNLGVNTPSRDLDLYIAELLTQNGVHFDSICQIIGGNSAISYGTHRVMPFLVTPWWYLKRGQSLLSVHFWNFIAKRSSKVIVSWISPLSSSAGYTSGYAKYGVRYLEYKLEKEIRSENASDIICNHDNHFWAEIRYNYASQTRFFQILRSKFPVFYLHMPAYGNSLGYLKKNNILSECYPGLPILALDPGQIDYLNNQKYWADGGHLNRSGNIIFTQFLEQKLSNNDAN